MLKFGSTTIDVDFDRRAIHLVEHALLEVTSPTSHAPITKGADRPGKKCVLSDWPLKSATELPKTVSLESHLRICLTDRPFSNAHCPFT